MICPNCSKEIRDTAKVCGYCGHRLQTPPAKCPDCGKDVREGAKVCGYCGHRFAEAVPELSPGPQPETVPEQKAVPEEQVPAPAEITEKPLEAPPKLEPVPKPKAKPAKIEANIHSRSEAEAPKPGKRSLIWVWILIALIAITGIFMLGQTRAWFTQEIFAGAIGNWESQDIFDNSHQTLTIRRTIQGEYRLDYYDDFATTCNGGAASGTMSGKTSASTLNTKMNVQCESGYGTTSDLYVVNWTYNPTKDTLKDSWGKVWTRQ